jgi:hypothetical protein
MGIAIRAKCCHSLLLLNALAIEAEERFRWPAGTTINGENVGGQFREKEGTGGSPGKPRNVVIEIDREKLEASIKEFGLRANGITPKDLVEKFAKDLEKEIGDRLPKDISPSRLVKNSLDLVRDAAGAVKGAAGQGVDYVVKQVSSATAAISEKKQKATAAIAETIAAVADIGAKIHKGIDRKLADVVGEKNFVQAQVAAVTTCELIKRFSLMELISKARVTTEESPQHMTIDLSKAKQKAKGFFADALEREANRAEREAASNPQIFGTDRARQEYVEARVEMLRKKLEKQVNVIGKVDIDIIKLTKGDKAKG